MKTYRLIITLLLIIPFFACTSQTSEKKALASNDSSDKIEAYYFHFTARCVTCKTIEAKAKENLETLYPNQVKQGLITFQSVNLEEDSSKPLGRKTWCFRSNPVACKRRPENQPYKRRIFICCG